jgi:hypothetical protein
VGGGLDCDWVELEGIVRPTGPVGLQLILKGGHVNLRLGRPADFDSLMLLTNAWVKLRGCVIPYRTSEGQVTGAALILVPTADFVTVKQAAPANLYALPIHHVADLLRFNPQRGFPAWTKLSGNVTHVRQRVCMRMAAGWKNRVNADLAGQTPANFLPSAA